MNRPNPIYSPGVKITGLRWCHANAGSGSHAFIVNKAGPGIAGLTSLCGDVVHPHEVNTIGALTYCPGCVAEARARATAQDQRSPDSARRLGGWQGRVKIADDFDAPMPEFEDLFYDSPLVGKA